MATGQRGRAVSKYSHLLDEDPPFRAWHANVVWASHNAGGHYFLRMGRLSNEVCHRSPAKTSPFAGS